MCVKKKHLCQVFQTKESYYFHPFTEESENLNPNPPEEVQKLFIFFPSIYYHHAKVALLLRCDKIAQYGASVYIY